MDTNVNRQRALEMAVGLAANGRIESHRVIAVAEDYLEFLDD